MFFGLNSRFGAVWGRDWWSYALGSFPLAEQLGLSKSTGLRFSDFLEDSAPALPVSQSLSDGLSCASVIEVTVDGDEKSVVDKEGTSRTSVRHVRGLRRLSEIKVSLDIRLEILDEITCKYKKQKWKQTDYAVDAGASIA